MQAATVSVMQLINGACPDYCNQRVGGIHE